MAQYALLLDADMCLEIDHTIFDKSRLTAAAYTIPQGSADFDYHNVRLLRFSECDECVGSTHEYYNVRGKTERLPGLRIQDIGDGGCKADKFERDIRLLSRDLTVNPHNARAHFYLANSYRDTRQWDRAIRHYRERIALGGWYEEVWYSYYSLGKCLRRSGRAAEALVAWLDAYQFYPGRMENIYEIVHHYRVAGKHALALRYYQWAASVPKPARARLFMHHNIYDYALDYEYSIFYYYLSDELKKTLPPRKIHDIFYLLLRRGHCVDNVLSNHKFYAPRLADRPGARAVRLEVPELGSVFQPSTPALVVTPRGRLLANVRHNNTVLSADQTRYTRREKREITRNQWVYVDRDGAAQGHGEMSEDTPCPDGEDLFAGRQDVRLLRAGARVLYTATVCRPGRALCIEYGRYDLKAKRLRGTAIPSPRNSACEKNWCLFEHQGRVRCIYGWSPIVVGALEGGRFVERARWDTPGECCRMRGSTHGAWRGEELWFGVHMVSHEKPRQYFHALVVVDPARRKVLRMTHPFKLEGQAIEYVCSLDFPDEHTARLAYSISDARPSWLEVPIDTLAWHVPPA